MWCASAAATAWQVVAIFVLIPQGVGVNRDGAFAEYVAIPATNVFRPNVYIPTDLSEYFRPLRQRGAHRAVVQYGG